MTQPSSDRPSILLLGASRGLGLALAAGFASRGWDVVGTVRDVARRTPLHDLAESDPDHVRVESCDVTDPATLDALHERLRGRSFDILFVTAGTTSHQDTPIGQVPTDAFVTVMVTNALGPVRAIETLSDLVTPTGLLGVMTSGQGSIANNTTAGREVYRGSKAALNMYLRSIAVRQADTGRAFLLLAPGWVGTDLGGDGATYTVEETTPLLVDILLDKRGRPGLEYLDRFGRTVPW